MQLINDKVVKLRSNVSGLVPGKVRPANDAVARERAIQFPGKWIPFRAGTAIANHEEFVAITIAHPGKKTSPMPQIVRREQILVVRRSAVYTGVHAMSMGCPDAKSRATLDEVRTHRRLVGNAIE